MSSFFQALEEGYPPEEIIKYLSKAIPQLANPVRKASKAGYTTKQILGFLSKNFDTEDRRGMSETERQSANRRSDSQMMKYGLKMAASAIAAPIAGAAAQSALSRALPRSLQALAPQVLGSNNPSEGNESNPLQSASATTPQPPQSSNQIQNPLSSSQPPVNAPNLPQVPNPVQPEGISNPKEYLEKLGIKDKVDELLARGNPPESVAAALGIQRGGGTKIDPELTKAIESYANQKEPNQEVKNPMEPGRIEQPNTPQQAEPIGQEPQPILSESDNEEHEAPRIEKGKFIKTPKGVGTILELRGDKALVEVEGVKHQFNQDELEGTPFTEDDIANAYESYMAMIPEEHKSGFISWGGYDEETNTIGFIPRGGKYEILTDVTPEEAEKIKTGKGVARTSGDKTEGLWIEGEGTKGGVISQILHDRRKAREASDKQQLTLFDVPKKEKQDKGMKPIFDENKFGRDLSKERERKKKLEAREKKKKEKDEAKKRKK